MVRNKNPRGAQRPERVGDLVREELMNLFLCGAVRDPAVAGVMISSVVMTADLQIAKVYVRLLATEVEPPAIKALMRGLRRANGFLRREVGRTLRLRRTPELRFHWDETVDNAAHIESVLEEIRAEEPSG